MRRVRVCAYTQKNGRPREKENFFHGRVYGGKKEILHLQFARGITSPLLFLLPRHPWVLTSDDERAERLSQKCGNSNKQRPQEIDFRLTDALV